MHDIDNQAQINHAQKMLLQLKQDFLSELPDRYTEIEDLILQLGKSPNTETTFEELYRKVHSLKGSAGTFGVHIITTICHHLEDLLNTIEGNYKAINGEFIDSSLRYVDLIKKAGNNPDEDSQINRSIEEELEAIRTSSLNNKLSGLVIVGSTLISLIVNDTLSSLPVQLSTEEDGLTALSRLLHERFDFLIIGYELDVLNGEALTCAIRASNHDNKNIPVIMISTKDNLDIISGLAPDYMIKKDINLSDNLSAAITEVLEKIKQKGQQ